MTHNKQDEQDIERLLAAAGRRQSPPDDMRARVYASTLQAWEALPERSEQATTKRAWTPLRYLAMAASALVAVALGVVMLSGREVASGDAAQVVFARGTFLVGEIVGLTGIKLGGSDSLRTGPDSIVTFRTARDALVTLDRDTEIMLAGIDELALRRGRIYVDAHGKQSTLTVVTKHSKITDVGTQFEVQVSADGEELLLALREGQVDVRGPNHAFSAAAHAGRGDVIRMRGERIAEQQSVATTDARWNWRREGREAYALAGSTVYEYLNWMARDSGHQLHFASKAVEQMSKIGILQGKGSLRSSDDTNIEDALTATRFRIAQPLEGQWVVHFRS